ncbi:hypothetical protein A33M_1732 [Rhodovulum sp. PH10]|uniref:hypothetical protein n=1 Tax=Rhodovulum sp. PH10 TaxID=1187851 RepID=UPI00027C24C8|nr:hypothetical protein [Rhodovulum sp. PH10]EJW12762.1 hypothetical protein A33M_1732 [Rhodovulum sp. PH10]
MDESLLTLIRWFCGAALVLQVILITIALRLTRQARRDATSLHAQVHALRTSLRKIVP